MRFNINDRVLVKLTDRGRRIHREQIYPFMRERYSPPKEDADGWSSWVMWDLMNLFGPFTSMAQPPPFEMEIEIPDAE